MILKNVKILGAHLQPDGSYTYDLELPEPLKSGDEAWINPTNLHNGWGWYPGGQYVSVISAPSDGRGAGLFATRTDTTTPGAMYSGLDFILNQNMPKEKGWCYGYGMYGEVYKQSYVHEHAYSQGIELAMINRHPYISRVTPHNPNPLGMTELIRLCTESLGPQQDYNSSVALTFGGSDRGSVRWWTGINFMHNAIDPDGDAIALAEGTPISWYASDGTRTRITVVNGELTNLDKKNAVNNNAVNS